jgi:hypothetical protein
MKIMLQHFHEKLNLFIPESGRIVIASETKQSRHFREIATHLSGARNDSLIKLLSYLSPDLDYRLLSPPVQ